MPELLSCDGEHFGFEKWGDEEMSLVADGLNLRLECWNVATLLLSQENAQHGSNKKAELGRKLSTFLLVNNDHLSSQISGKRNGFGFAPVEMQGEHA